MKNFIKSFAFIFVLSAILFACQSKTEPQVSQIGVLNEGDCKIIGMVYNYENMTSDIKFQYDEKNRVTQITRKTNDYLDRVSKIMYTDEGQIGKYEVYQEDTLAFFETFTWKKDLCIVSLFGLEENEWVNKNKIALTYDEQGHLILLDDYFVDSNDVWSLKGTLYDFKWDNGNVSEIANYIVVNDSVENALGNYTNEKEFLLVNINEEELIVDTYSDLELFYTANYEYYDIPNPLNHLSIAKTIVPNEYNCSRNIPKKILKTYSSGEQLIVENTIKTNEKGYPIQLDIVATFNSIVDTIRGEYNIQVEYENCQ